MSKSPLPGYVKVRVGEMLLLIDCSCFCQVQCSWTACNGDGQSLPANHQYIKNVLGASSPSHVTDKDDAPDIMRRLSHLYPATPNGSIDSVKSELWPVSRLEEL